MFRLNRVTPTPPGTDRTRQLLRRALYFAAGLALLWLALRLTPSASHAPLYSDDSGTVAVDAPPASDAEPTGLLTPGTLLALLLLAGGGAYAWHLRRRVTGAGTGIALRTLGCLPVGPSQQLRLVACGDEVLLLGITAGQITLLKSYSAASFETEAPGWTESEEPAAVAIPRSFADVLRDQFGRSLNVQKAPTSC